MKMLPDLDLGYVVTPRTLVCRALGASNLDPLFCPSDTPEITVGATSLLYGDILTATVTTSYLTSVPSIHWSVNGVRTSSSTTRISGGRVVTSQLYWPVTQDLEITATLHQYDLGQVATATKHVTVYGVERVEGPGVAHIGGRYNLTCVVDASQPLDEIMWTRDGVRVEELGQVQEIELSGKVCGLSLVFISSIIANLFSRNFISLPC